jgi:PST family polysaccharide transporter
MAPTQVISPPASGKSGFHKAEFAFLRRNVFSLYILYFASYSASIVTLPYLTRTLGPEGFGVLASAQAYAWCIQMVVEYGFNFSGSKAAQSVRHDREALGALVGNVNGAKLLLFAAAFCLTLLFRPYVSALAHSQRFFFACLGFGLAQGLSPVWFFQGTDRMRLFTVLDVISRCLATAGIVIWVKSPADAPLALELQAAGAAVTTVVGFVVAGRAAAMRLWTVAGVRRVLSEGRSLFAYRLTTNVHMYANPLILSMFAAPSYVAFYSAPERIVKFLLMTITPFSEAVYPFLSRKFDASAEEGRRLATSALILTVVWTSMMSAGLLIGAPFIIRTALGRNFDGAIEVIRILAVFPIAAGIVNCLGIQWMLPSGLGSAYNRIVAAVFVIHVALAAMLARRYHHVGMAMAVVASQVVAAALMWLAIRKNARLRHTPKAELASL